MLSHAFQNPEEYKRHSDLQYQFAHMMIKETILRPDYKILDIGTGDGRIARDMADFVPKGKVIGTDISKAMILIATKDHVPHKNNNLDFMIMSAEANIFFNQFDIVTSFCCLHWIKDQLSALIGIKNALIPDGKTVLLVPLRHEELYVSIETTMALSKWKSYFLYFTNPHIFFTYDQYLLLLNQAKLNIQSLEETIMEYSFTNKTEMELFLKAWLPHMQFLPEKKHNEFLSDIGDNFLQIVPPHNGTVLMPLKMLKVRATKQN